MPLAAQAPPDPVQWSASLKLQEAVRQGSTLTVTVAAAIQPGWHVYGFKQAPTGPIPLRVTVDGGDVATAGGTPSGSPPEVVHDPRFGVDTQLYTHAFTVRVPVRVAGHVTAGPHPIDVNVRFQSCSDRECLPPRTVHLSVPVTVAADR